MTKHLTDARRLLGMAVKMGMQVVFDNDFQRRLMNQSFASPTVITTPQDVQSWRSAWMGALSSWHSPYKVMIDCTQLSITGGDDVKKALELMLKFFGGFFLRKTAGFGRREGQGHELLPFSVHATEDEAAADLGLRQGTERKTTDFRSIIQLQNHFQQHVMELSFAEPVVIETKEQAQTLRSKLMNNLMQWHSKWSLLVDCANLEVAPEIRPEIERVLAALKGFFMKEAIGYSPRGAKETYPFTVYRARHRAAAVLEGEGNFSGDKADCKSRKV